MERGVGVGIVVGTICTTVSILIVDDDNELEFGVEIGGDCVVVVAVVLIWLCTEITSVLVDTRPPIPIIVCAIPSASEKDPSPELQLHLPA